MKPTDYSFFTGRPVAYYPDLRKITGSINAALFLCQLIYWDGKQRDPQGWIYKNSDEIEDETGLTYEEQRTARRKLVERGFIHEKFKRLEHKIHYRIDSQAVDAALESLGGSRDDPDAGSEVDPDSGGGDNPYSGSHNYPHSGSGNLHSSDGANSLPPGGESPPSFNELEITA
jgi:hypothetical protein